MSVGNCVATLEVTSEDSDNNYGEISEKDLLIGYEIMLKKFDKMILQNRQHEEEQESIQKKLIECEKKLIHAKKPIDSMNKGKAKFVEILALQRPQKSKSGIGYIGETLGLKKD